MLTYSVLRRSTRPVRHKKNRSEKSVIVTVKLPTDLAGVLENHVRRIDSDKSKFIRGAIREALDTAK